MTWMALVEVLALVGTIMVGLYLPMFMRKSIKDEPLGKAEIYQSGAKTYISFLLVNGRKPHTKVENVKVVVDSKVNAVLVSVGGDKHYYQVDGEPEIEVILPNEEMKKKWIKLLQKKIQPRQDIVPTIEEK